MRFIQYHRPAKSHEDSLKKLKRDSEVLSVAGMPPDDLCPFTDLGDGPHGRPLNLALSRDLGTGCFSVSFRGQRAGAFFRPEAGKHVMGMSCPWAGGQRTGCKEEAATRGRENAVESPLTEPSYCERGRLPPVTFHSLF